VADDRLFGVEVRLGYHVLTHCFAPGFHDPVLETPAKHRTDHDGRFGRRGSFQF